MAFLKWSKNNPSAKQILRPDLGMRSWDEVDVGQKRNMWLHFTNSGWFSDDEITYFSVDSFNDENKAASFCNHLLQHGGPHYHEYGITRLALKDCCKAAAQQDLEYVFLNQKQDVFYELVSHYVSYLEIDPLNRERTERFRNMFNDISDQFGLNVLLGENSFTIKQDKKIIDEIYAPVLNFLKNDKWKLVSRDLNDASIAYLKNTEEEYSTCITLTVSALQAFLQIIVFGKIGKGDIDNLIKEAQSKKLIPSDPFTTKIFSNIQSILMQERQGKGNAHPKTEYANEKTARVTLNLVMIFMQHCVQN
jgi:hypothetical protein